ncbi:SusC/RagA family TonB-linked outer membrane protein [Chitinophaga ginsengisoli]|uniref:TonB-linked SusC/RagA family outer membrane protein n=1 Tax=Chitinophaga ginsengisoli TaxID=363837 RepID=A0A2P8FUG7_9BACT|nr:SusC/RagA family TonB-linked outer membrane protein [Chitinophaga ginsengisoli]PSL25367.1 TonB-linked SusC/RagA family outer membrane protein [Chitinophaga ginsengisoli]
MRHLRLLVVAMLLSTVAFAQTRQVQGTVKDSKSGAPLGSVSIKVQGKNIFAITGADGAFTLKNVPEGEVTLETSLIGYTSKGIKLAAGQTSVDFTMEESSSQLGEVTVTALGISKESKKLGYSVTKVDGASLTQARETNVAYSLGGRVAGLSVSGTNGGPGSSARVLLRGMASFGASSPLYVINGVPMDNSQRGAAGEWGGSDNGDGISNINPDDIESMTVLKGASASALYGTRATNGVILITTKSGKKGTMQVEYNTNYTLDKAIDYTEYQYTYGQGQHGAKPVNAADALSSTRLSWGTKLDGSMTPQFDGKSYAYSAVDDNISRFYRTGPTFTNTLSVSGGGDKGVFRVSASSMDNHSILRNSGLKRKTFNLNLEQNLTTKLKVSALVNYIDDRSQNRPQLSDGPLNANNGLFLATNIDEDLMKPGYNPDNNGREVVWTDDNFVTNPWFVVNQFINNIDRRRWISALTVRYDLFDFLYAQARIGYDNINDRKFKVTPWGTAYSTSTLANGTTVSGDLDLRNEQSTEMNADGLIGFKKNIVEDLQVDLAVGGNLRKRTFEMVGVSGNQFIIPYVYSYSNVTNFGRNYDYQARESQSGYYTADFSYKGFLTIGTTGRYDVYSTLPAGNRSIFVPSVSGSFIFSELVHIPKLNYGKLRASWANASGEPTDAYITKSYYNVGSTIAGVSTGDFSSTLPNLYLKPFKLKEAEVGLELKFFENRLGIDLAYFHRKTNSEIIQGTISSATGYDKAYFGTGSTLNKGFEAAINGTIVSTSNFTWNASVNGTYIKNKILDIYGSNSSSTVLTLGTYRPLNANTALVKGMSGPQILAYDFKRDDKGQLLLDASGLPQNDGVLRPMGSVLPKFFGGINNDFSYKGFNLSFLIDGKFGAKLLSATKDYAVYRGLDKATLAGRESGIVVDGIIESTGEKNTKNVDAQTYYQAYANKISKNSVLDADFIKLRQVTLGYTMGRKVLGKTPFESIGISLVARNLLTLMRKSDNVDPEAGFSSLINYAGIEGTSLPSTRTYGVNVNVKFKK